MQIIRGENKIPEQKALSRRQFAESGFDTSGYTFNDVLGKFIATIDCKHWGKNNKLVTYMTFEDGRKVVAPTWRSANYQGLADLEIGTKIRGNISLTAVAHHVLSP